MPDLTNRYRSWIALSAVVLSLAGCGGDEKSPGVSANQDVTVDGSSTVFRISKAAQEAFAKANAEVNVIVNSSGTGGGFSKYMLNEVDIVDASRAAKKDEEAKAKEQGLDWVRFLVGYDGITIVVNPKNDFVKELSVEQLKKLWEPESKVKTWKDLDASWPDREIKLYSPDDKSGTFEFFTEATVGKAKSQRKDGQRGADDNILVHGVSEDPDAIGYFGYAYYQRQTRPRVSAAIPIKKKHRKQRPIDAQSPTAILDGSYAPLSRPLFHLREEIVAIVRRGSGCVRQVSMSRTSPSHWPASDAGYVAPTAEGQRKANKKTPRRGRLNRPGRLIERSTLTPPRIDRDRLL